VWAAAPQAMPLLVTGGGKALPAVTRDWKLRKFFDQKFFFHQRLHENASARHTVIQDNPIELHKKMASSVVGNPSP
jgi:hypothetical protein